jgi:hypothetical protein
MLYWIRTRALGWFGSVFGDTVLVGVIESEGMLGIAGLVVRLENY